MDSTGIEGSSNSISTARTDRLPMTTTDMDHLVDERSDAYGMRGHDVRAGDRASDAPRLVALANVMADETWVRLFDLFDPMLRTVLIFSFEVSENETCELCSPRTRATCTMYLDLFSQLSLSAGHGPRMRT